MNVIIALLAGLGTGTGLLLAAAGLWAPPATSAAAGLFGRLRARILADPQRHRRLLYGTAAAVFVFVATGWPVGAGLAGLAGATTPTILGARQRRDDAIAHTEALATWAEQLRDTISSSAGLQEALALTAATAPAALREPLAGVADGMRDRPLPELLKAFADTVCDPTCDQIVVSLILATQHRGQNLTDVLGDVAAAARQDAEMRMRTETSRAQTYADAKAVTFVVLGVFGLLLVGNRGYLDAYSGLAGQTVLGIVGAMWTGALVGLGELSRVRVPARLLTVNDSPDPRSAVDGGGADWSRPGGPR
jgi:Flp pilus assembly protein TadB